MSDLGGGQLGTFALGEGEEEEQETTLDPYSLGGVQLGQWVLGGEIGGTPPPPPPPPIPAPVGVPYTLVPNTSIPHLQIPFSIGPGGAANTVEQDTWEDVAQCVAVVAGTLQGTRTVLPTYGLPEIVIAQQLVDTSPIEGAISTWEPRAQTQVSTTLDPNGQPTVTIAVSVANSS